MKKIIIIAGALCVLASFSANAQTSAQLILEFPDGRNLRDISNDHYWRQVRLNQEAEERARHEAREHHDNGNHYAYGKDKPKKHDKKYGKNYPKYYHNENDHHRNNR